MFLFYADKVQILVRKRETVTSGSVNVYSVAFQMSSDWEGLQRTAVFKAGGESRSLLLEPDNRCAIPWEVLQKPGVRLQAGLCGVGEDGTVVLPTIWADCGVILEGASPGESAQPPTPELWEQELAGKGDRLDYTGDGELGLYAGDRLLSAIPLQGGGGESGTSDHRLLSHRDAEKQHPIQAIDGLEAALASIPTAMTAEELRKILMNGGMEHV